MENQSSPTQEKQTLKVPKITAVIKPTWNWLPDPRRTVVKRNGNYFRSLVAGCVSPLFHLPSMIWNLILWPTLRGSATIFVIVVGGFFAGLFGMITGFDVNLENEKGEDITPKQMKL